MRSPDYAEEKVARGVPPAPRPSAAQTEDGDKAAGYTSSPRFAFFDVDETLIRTKSMFSFKEFFCRNCAESSGSAGVLEHRRFMRSMADYQRRGMSREFINRKYYESYRNLRPEDVRDCARRWFRKLKEQRPDLYVEPVVNLLRKHRASGEEPVLVSGSSVEILAPLAEELDVRHVLATRLEVRDGRYTGRILPPQMIGGGKREALEAFIQKHGAPAEECFAYGDHPSDLPMLEAVGNPNAVGGDARLKAIAAELGWNVVHTQKEETMKGGSES